MLPSEILLFVQCLVPFVSTTGIYRNDDFMNVCQFALANGIPGFHICFESFRQKEGGIICPRCVLVYLSNIEVDLICRTHSLQDVQVGDMGCLLVTFKFAFHVSLRLSTAFLSHLLFLFLSQLTACNVEILKLVCKGQTLKREMVLKGSTKKVQIC